MSENTVHFVKQHKGKVAWTTVFISLAGLVTAWLSQRAELTTKASEGSVDRQAIWRAIRELDTQIDQIKLNQSYWKGYADAVNKQQKGQ